MRYKSLTQWPTEIVHSAFTACASTVSSAPTRLPWPPRHLSEGYDSYTRSFCRGSNRVPSDYQSDALSTRLSVPYLRSYLWNLRHVLHSIRKLTGLYQTLPLLLCSNRTPPCPNCCSPCCYSTAGTCRANLGRQRCWTSGKNRWSPLANLLRINWINAWKKWKKFLFLSQKKSLLFWSVLTMQKLNYHHWQICSGMLQ